MQEMTEEWLDETETAGWHRDHSRAPRDRLTALKNSLLGLGGGQAIYCVTARLAEVLIKSRRKADSEHCAMLGTTSTVKRAVAGAFARHPYSMLTQNRKVGGAGNRSNRDVYQNVRKTVNVIMRIDPPVVHVEELRRLIHSYKPPLRPDDRLLVVLSSYCAQLLYLAARVLPQALREGEEGVRYFTICRVIAFSFMLGWALYYASVPVNMRTSTLRLMLTDFLRIVVDVVEVVEAQTDPETENGLGLVLCLTSAMLQAAISGYIKSYGQGARDSVLLFFKPIRGATRELETFVSVVVSALTDIGASRLTEFIVDVTRGSGWNNTIGNMIYLASDESARSASQKCHNLMGVRGIPHTSVASAVTAPHFPMTGGEAAVPATPTPHGMAPEWALRRLQQETEPPQQQPRGEPGPRFRAFHGRGYKLGRD